MAQQNRDAVIGLLGYCHAFIAQAFEHDSRKFRPLQFLQQQYIGLAGFSHAVTWSRRARIELTFQLAILMTIPPLPSSAQVEE